MTLHQILKVYAPKRKFCRNYNYRSLIVNVLLTLGPHAVFIEFCKKLWVNFVRCLQPINKSEIPRLFFIKSLVFCFCCQPQHILVSLYKIPFLSFLNLSVTKGNMLNFMSIVYIQSDVS